MNKIFFFDFVYKPLLNSVVSAQQNEVDFKRVMATLEFFCFIHSNISC